ncbi:MAG: extensin family protein [Deltaproteobacteria bacterium]|nr:extensin family protein [Deltaproteobacteria bacterium]
MRGAACAVAWLATVLPWCSAGDEPGGTDEAPWYAPWRAVRVQTVDDAEKAWGMVRDFFGNMRQGHEHEVWVVDQDAMPRARPLEDCLAELEEDGLDFPRADRGCRMSAQVEVDGPVEGVTFTGRVRDGVAEPLELGCELALRLPRLARVLREAGVRTVVVGEPARFTLRSYHRFGLAFDVYKLELDDGTTLVVKNDFVLQPDAETCAGDPPQAAAGAKLREIACALWDERVLSTVITPNYNEGHHDHFHWDVRPGDDRFYLR